jgi:hypothetical protein
MKIPQLSTRDLFWLTLVVAMGLGWWLDRQQLVKFHKWDLEAQRLQHEIVGSAARDIVQEFRWSFSKGRSPSP